MSCARTEPWHASPSTTPSITPENAFPKATVYGNTKGYFRRLPAGRRLWGGEPGSLVGPHAETPAACHGDRRGVVAATKEPVP